MRRQVLAAEAIGVSEVTRDLRAADVDGAVLVIAIHEEPTLRWPVRYLASFKADQPPADPQLCALLAADLRCAADELERRGWDAFTEETNRRSA